MTEEARFWSKVDKSGGDDACWLWTASSNVWGYGEFRLTDSNRNVRAHRYSYELAYGPVPEGKIVCHDCPDGDNPLCVNPRHLWAGTDEENNHDMIAKGRARHVRGEDVSLARLTEEHVRQIRQRHAEGPVNSVALAREYGVSKATILRVIHRQTWQHVK
jgi:hypothetical protein